MCTSDPRMQEDKFYDNCDIPILEQDVWLELNDDVADNSSELIDDYNDRMRHEGWG